MCRERSIYTTVRATYPPRRVYRLCRHREEPGGLFTHSGAGKRSQEASLPTQEQRRGARKPLYPLRSREEEPGGL